MRLVFPSFRRRKPRPQPAHIAILPDDILYEIFYLVVAGSSRGEPDGGLNNSIRSGSGSIHGVVISHVCGYWRSLALASPQLWTFIYVVAYTKADLLAECLARAGTAPLTIRLQSDNSYTRPSLLAHAYTLSSYADRFVEFEASTFEGDDMCSMLSALTFPANRLHALHLRSHQWVSPAKRPSIFADSMPSLRDALVVGVPTPWSYYSRLTSLILSHQSAPSMAELVLALQNCPDLQVLVLKLHGSMSPTDLFQRPPTIALCRLRKLCLNWAQEQDGLLHILACLSFPSTAVMQLIFQDQRDISFVLQQSESLRAMAANIRTAEIWLQHDADTRVVVYFRSEDASQVVKWQFSTRSADEAVAGLKRIGLPALPYLSLENLDLRMYGVKPLDESVWSSLLIHVPLTVGVGACFYGATEYNTLAFLSSLRNGHRAIGEILCPNLLFLDFVSHQWISPNDVLGDILFTFRTRATRGSRQLISLNIGSPVPSRDTKPPKSLSSQLRDVIGTVAIS